MWKSLLLAFAVLILLIVRDIDRYGPFAGIGIGILLVPLVVVIQWMISNALLNRRSRNRPGSGAARKHGIS